MKARGAQGMRAVQGLISLARRHTSAEIDRACELAVKSGAYRLKAVKARIGSAEEQTQLFVSKHPIIRSLAAYGRVVKIVIGDGTADVVPILAPRPRPLSDEAGAEGRVH